MVILEKKKGEDLDRLTPTLLPHLWVKNQIGDPWNEKNRKVSRGEGGNSKHNNDKQQQNLNHNLRSLLLKVEHLFCGRHCSQCFTSIIWSLKPMQWGILLFFPPLFHRWRNKRGWISWTRLHSQYVFQAVRKKFMRTRGDRETVTSLARLIFQIENLLI